jgi:hypothetical protein
MREHVAHPFGAARFVGMELIGGDKTGYAAHVTKPLAKAGRARFARGPDERVTPCG